MPFDFKKLAIPEVLLIAPRVSATAADFSWRPTNDRSSRRRASTEIFVQENHSSSQRGVLRGLHFQRPPHAQSKLVRVVSGRMFDVAVDLRPDSPTGALGRRELSADDRTLMYIPEWCAHGFCVLSERAEVVYHTSAEYSPEHESGIMWNDPALGITGRSPIRSCRTGISNGRSWLECDDGRGSRHRRRRLHRQQLRAPRARGASGLAHHDARQAHLRRAHGDAEGRHRSSAAPVRPRRHRRRRRSPHRS